MFNLTNIGLICWATEGVICVQLDQYWSHLLGNGGGDLCSTGPIFRHGIFPPIGGFLPIERSHGSFLRSVQIR